MTTLNISLPEQMRTFIESQVSRGLYSTASDYIRNLIRDDQKREDQERLESLLLDALEGGGSQEVTPEFFRAVARARPAGDQSQGKRDAVKHCFGFHRPR
jgi:antitoxin ParD1/3/4